MIDDDLLPYLPSLLETKSDLFTTQDLQDLDNTLSQIQTLSDDEAEETLNNFYITHPHIRDELENLEEGDRELKKVKPSQANQSTRTTNFFQELSQQVKDKLKSESKKPDSDKSNG
ncbi:MAG: hypothetical protein RID09_27910 [Coleofasciculus sp. G1-WW12-02]|uniref:hypothetical protein n=1 Tax=Coleofasciculus sp. G1-WW12-02 TaxID=3068483 RepID=UPI0032F535C9